MDEQQSITRKRRLRCSRTTIHRIIGLIILNLIILFVIHDNLSFYWIFLSSSSISYSKSMLSPRSATNLLLLYEETLSRVENAPFLPTFHNHRLTLKLNLTSMAKDHFDYFKNNPKKKIHQLKIITLQSPKNVNNFHSICDIYLTFNVKMINTEEVRLIFLFENTNCSVSLMNTSDTISMNIHRTFSVNDTFRFTHQWSDLDKAKSIFWPQWPITTGCLDWYWNNLTRNESQFSKLKISSFQCPFVSILMHSTSRELFTEEQTAVSHWLDLQYKASIDQEVSDRTDKFIYRRRLAPFEIAKDPTVCSNEFQNWIWKYQRWHENISFIINNRSMSIEEQRKRIIELDVRFLIYEKPTTGTADRIIHLVSTYLVALLTNRLLIFDANWPEVLDVVQSSLNYEQKLVIPWFSQFNMRNNDFTLQRHFFSFDRFTKDYNYEKTFPQRILLFSGHTGGVIHTIESNSSIYRKFLTTNLKINTNQIFGCLYNSLFTYRLSQLIKRVPLTSTNQQLSQSSQQILQTLLSPRFFPIGIQIRVGDHTMIETNSGKPNPTLYDEQNIGNLTHFFRCAQDIIDKNEIIFKKTDQKYISLLISDSLLLRQTALKRWQLPLKCFQSFKNECQWNNKHFYILANSNPAFHIEKTKNQILAFQLGMFDMFLFSLCEQHIISGESGFGRLPAFASLKQRNIYSFRLNESHSCRDEGLSLVASGHQWSGI